MRLIFCVVLLGTGLVTCQLTQFPDYFKFGTASASYQVEGAWDAEGKGENIWDRMTHSNPDSVYGRHNGDVATDSYHKYKEDVQLMKAAGMDFYRFSISWSRVMPRGDTSVLNEPGLQYYDNLINELLANDIEPVVTMYHWDLPQPLQEIGGMVNPEIIWYFVQYADVLFERYGDRVKNWITFNEPQVFCLEGYGYASKAPLIYAPGVGNYICGHHVLLANAKMYDLYYSKYAAFGGRVGISINCEFDYPEIPGNPDHEAAAERGMLFYFGQFTQPIFGNGDYPAVMKEIIDARSKREGRAWSRLPVFTEEEKILVKGKADFLGLNYYSPRIAAPAININYDPGLYTDREIESTVDPSWPQAKSNWLFSQPDGLRQLLNWFRRNYNNPEVIITENGWSDDGELEDTGRITYLRGHLQATLDAINDGCNVTAHTTWSILDNFEWMMGYSEHFGIHYVDFDDDERPRTQKASVGFLRNIILTRRID